VDKKNVILDYSKKEKEVAIWLVNTFGGIVKMIPRVNNPEGIKTPDYIFKNQKFDLKEIMGTSKRSIDDSIKNKKLQAQNFILDISNTTLSIVEIKKQIDKIYKDPKRKWINVIILKQDNNLLLVYKRK